VTTVSSSSRSPIPPLSIPSPLCLTEKDRLSSGPGAPSNAPIPTTPVTPRLHHSKRSLQIISTVPDLITWWLETACQAGLRSLHGSPQAGADGLVSCLRNFFARFGVPVEIFSDGGPEFVAKSTSDFLQRQAQTVICIKRTIEWTR